MEFLFVKLLLLTLSICYANCASLSTVSDDAVLEAIRDYKNLLILFSKRDCSPNCKFEQSVIALQDEFLDTFGNSKVLKVENSQLTRIYNPFKKEPALIFLRNGVPLIYDETDPDNADSIFQFFNENRDPLVRELDDSNFEHLTQASTGSTTGDWLVQFYDNSCVDCQRLQAIFETVAAKLKIRMNVARVNSKTKGIQTAKRFKVEKSPEFILLRQGKYYRYNLKKYDVESFVGFASNWFKNVGAEKVKVQASPFENLVDAVVEKLKNMQGLKDSSLSLFNDYPIVILIIPSLIVLYLLSKLFRSSSSNKKTTEKKSQEKIEKPSDDQKPKKKNAKKES